MGHYTYIKLIYISRNFPMVLMAQPINIIKMS